MNRRYETNQRLARLQAQLDSLDSSRPSNAAPLDLFAPDLQARFLRDGRVYDGKVY